MNVYLHNETSEDLKDAFVSTDGGDVVLLYAPIAQSTYTTNSNIPVKKTPENLAVEWTSIDSGTAFKKSLSVSDKLSSNNEHRVDTYISVIEGNEIRLSWIILNKNLKSLDCGGYIFDKYSDEAKPKIEERIKKWRAYLAKKEKDIKEGNTEPYKTEKYYDKVSEADFRCNHFSYVSPFNKKK